MSTVLDSSPHAVATAPDGLHPLRGNAVLARYGDLTLICEAVPGRQHRIGALLDAVAGIAAGEADARQLSRQVAGLIGAAAPDSDDFPALCAFGPTHDGLATIVHGGAELIVTVNGGQVHLDGRDAVTVLDRVITDRVDAVRAVVGGTDLGPVNGSTPPAVPALAEPALVQSAPAPPRPAAPTPAAPEPTSDSVPARTVANVSGVRCARDHFNDPAVAYCSVCGLSMAQAPRSPEMGPRPQLGVLVLDDGTTVALVRDVLLGRMPEIDEAVAAGDVDPVTLADPLVSRRHARIALRDWQVVVSDLESANGTFVMPRGTGAWNRLEPGVETVLEAGFAIAAGMRQLRYFSHRHC
jgi:hypothetical protein